MKNSNPFLPFFFSRGRPNYPPLEHTPNQKRLLHTVSVAVLGFQNMIVTNVMIS